MFFSVTVLTQILSIGWRKLQTVSHKSISGAVQVPEHQAGCIYITPHFNPKRSGKRSTKALLVTDGNLWGCPSCQAGRELRAADITAPPVPAAESFVAVTPSCLPLAGQLSHSHASGTVLRPSACSPQRERLPAAWLCFLPKGIKCIGSGRRGLKDVGAVSPQLWKNTSPKRKPWHFSCKHTDRSAQGHKPSARSTQT